jgi:hypothetical protein
MIGRTCHFCIIISSVLLVSCVSQNGGGAPVTTGSFEYFLPKSVYDIALSYELKGCPSLRNGDIDKQDEIGGGFIQFSVNAEITERFVRDSSTKPLVFKPKEMEGFLKTASLTLEWYPNGTLKSINSASKDETGTVIGNILSFVSGSFGLARAISAPAYFETPPVQPLPPPPPICSPKAIEALEEIKNRKKEIDEIEATARNISIGSSAEEVAIAERLLSASIKKIDLLKARIAELRKSPLTISAKQEAWEPNSNSLTIRIAPSDKDLRKWHNLDAIRSLTETELAERYTVVAQIQFDQKISATAPLTDTSLAIPVISYRQPLRGVLTVCQGGACPLSPDDLHLKVIGKKEVLLSQFGEIVDIPLEAKAFEDRIFGLTFEPSGQVTKVQYQTNARAVAVSSALKTTVTESGTLVNQIRHGDEDAEIAILKRKKELLELKLKIEELEKQQE